MGNQSSEMKAQFQGKEGIPMSTAFSSGLQPPMYNHHHSKGPLKVSIISKNLSGVLYNGKQCPFWGLISPSSTPSTP